MQNIQSHHLYYTLSHLHHQIVGYISLQLVFVEMSVHTVYKQDLGHFLFYFLHYSYTIHLDHVSFDSS